MPEPSTFARSLRTLAGEIRAGGASHVELYRATTRVDGLGRQLHGIGFVRHAEIAACLMAAVEALAGAHEAPEERRPEAVLQAAAALETAVHLAEQGGVAGEG